jgi:NADH:ubiquinone oxidoreductase subunit E
MTRARTSDERYAELEFHASGFLVKVEGSWTATALAQFRHFLNLRRLSASTQELEDTLIKVKQKYFDGKNRFYLCNAEPCRGKFGFETSDHVLDNLSRKLGLGISKTGCQGPCKQAPVVSLRIGERSETFAQ